MVPYSHDQGRDDQSDQTETALTAAVSRVLRALARILLRHGVSFQAFSELAKRAYMESARDDFAIPGRKPTISRMAVLTGLSRKEIQRLTEAEPTSDTEALERYNRAARVVAGWVRDSDFRNDDGQPRALSLEDS